VNVREPAAEPATVANDVVATLSGRRPAVFTHDEVITLFHEFGTACIICSPRWKIWACPGINGVEWDAVRTASQFMENFCWEWMCCTE